MSINCVGEGGERVSNIFGAIVDDLIKKGQSYSTPRDFQDYCKQYGFDANTAQKISVDSLAKLDPYLIANNFMVLRLGKSKMGRGTAFGIVKCPVSLSDYFFIDETIFQDINPVGFIPDVPYSHLHCFNLIPNFTETSSVNLGLASGLFSKCLELQSDMSIPATGKSAYTFDFHPSSDLPQTIFRHNKGQVEIDAVFTAKINGFDSIILIEAKCGSRLDSLAKHKLAYSYWAIKPKLPDYMKIILVYVRVVKKNNFLRYYIVTCEFEGDFLNTLKTTATYCFDFPRGIGV